MADPDTRLRVKKQSPACWQVVFDNPPINLIDAQMIVELQQLIGTMEADPDLRVVVFSSAEPEFVLAHIDVNGDYTGMAPGSTGMHPWLDLLVRLSRASVVSIAALRGRARGAGSEFALACDIRFASRERAVLAQFEVGMGAVPGGNPMTRLPKLMGRGRALEVLLGADDFPGDLAERYGYVNRAVPDAEFEDFVEAFATRVSGFEKEALAETKAFVDKVTLPDDAEFHQR